MSLRILLVDDDATTLRLVGLLLRGEGHVVDPCSSAAIALEHLRTEHHDVLLTDLVMPGMGGQELAAAALQLHPNLRVVIMSGHERPADVGQGIVWLEKPIDVDVLVAAMTRQLE